MTPINKEIHRVLNLVLAINERGIADLTIDISGHGMTVSIYQWIEIDGVREIFEHWYTLKSSQCLLADLRKIRHDMAQILAGKAVQRAIGVAA